MALFERLLAPTHIYVKPLLALIRAMPVHALAHITGGGLTDNIPRVLPAGLEAVLERRSWPQAARNTAILCQPIGSIGL